MILDQDELFKLTKFRLPKKQAVALKFMGIEPTFRIDGSIVLLWSQVHRVLDGGASTPKIEKQEQPNWGAV